MPAGTMTVEPAWKARSPEPPAVEDPKTKWLVAAGIGLLLVLLVIAWNYASRDAVIPVPANVANNENRPPIVPSSEMPPQPRSLSQPANTNFYQNSKQNLKGDLLLNFVGFTMYYPKEWKVNGPKEGSTSARGKFLDISRNNADGQLLEQMLVSYYPSRGTFTYDAEKFPQLVRESNETLKKLLPDYQLISEGEIKLNATGGI